MRLSGRSLRHTFASRLVMAGVDIRTVQELLGHKTIAMTVRYSHFAPKHTLAAVERLDTHKLAQLTPLPTLSLRSGHRLTQSYCSKTLDSIGLQRQGPGGGMAYAGDLKSPDAHASCGFDPHPGHSRDSCYGLKSCRHGRIARRSTATRF